jgi:hypothetical protein
MKTEYSLPDSTARIASSPDAQTSISAVADNARRKPRRTAVSSSISSTGFFDVIANVPSLIAGANVFETATDFHPHLGVQVVCGRRHQYLTNNPIS